MKRILPYVLLAAVIAVGIRVLASSPLMGRSLVHLPAVHVKVTNPRMNYGYGVPAAFYQGKPWHPIIHAPAAVSYRVKSAHGI